MNNTSDNIFGDTFLKVLEFYSDRINHVLIFYLKTFRVSLLYITKPVELDCFIGLLPVAIIESKYNTIVDKMFGNVESIVIFDQYTVMFNKEAQLDSNPKWNMAKIELDAYGHMAI